MSNRPRVLMIGTRWQGWVLAAVLMSACHQQSDPGTAPQPPAEASPPAAAEGFEPQPGSLDEWIGRWNGPEGTYLSIAKNGEGYSVEIADLDGPRKYEGRSKAGHLEFDRNGKVETIRATDGVQTGMKWLSEKSDCLTIAVGEGFCRD